MIRPARASDVGGLTALEADAFGSDAWSSQQVEAELAGATRRTLVMETDGRLVGFGAIAVVGEVADLTRIVVAVTQRRSGRGSDLLAALHNTARTAGAQRVLLEVAESNAAALAFYLARDYTEISRRRAYYTTGDDALVLEHRLGN